MWLGPCITPGSNAWWRHQMETFSVLLAICAGNSPVPGEFPAQRPVTRSFDVVFDLRLNKRLSKQSWGWWFETLSGSLWRHCNEVTAAWWRHQMETFSALLAICEGNSPVTTGFPLQWRGVLMFPLICTWTNGWAKNRNAGDLRRHCAHYDVTLMRCEGLCHPRKHSFYISIWFSRPP